MSTEQADFESSARHLLKTTQLRITQPRLKTLATLLAQDQALSHGDLRHLMPHMDRVSLYRSLDWLVEQQLAFRITTNGQQRWAASSPHQHASHPHFSCNQCGRTLCLSDTSNPHVQLPAGYRLESVELVVKGICDTCVSNNTP